MDRNRTAAVDGDLSHHAILTEKIPENQTDLVARKGYKNKQQEQ